MKKGRPVLILFLVLFLLFLAAGVSLVFLEVGRPPSIAASSYLEIPLAGPIEELAVPSPWMSLLPVARPLSVHDVWWNLKKARRDVRIKGVLLRLGLLGGDWAKCAELREAVLDFRKSGKPIYAFIQEAPKFDKEYYLATACDRIILHPLGWLGITGAGGVVPFLKRGLDKLGIEAEVEHVEEYKTAYNMFTESGFTPAHREMLESIVSDQFATYVRTIAEARHKTEAEVRSLIDEGFFQGTRAVEAGLVDELLYEDQVAALFSSGDRPARRVALETYARVPSLAGGPGRRPARRPDLRKRGDPRRDVHARDHGRRNHRRMDPRRPRGRFDRGRRLPRRQSGRIGRRLRHDLARSHALPEGQALRGLDVRPGRLGGLLDLHGRPSHRRRAADPDRIDRRPDGQGQHGKAPRQAGRHLGRSGPRRAGRCLQRLPPMDGRRAGPDPETDPVDL